MAKIETWLKTDLQHVVRVQELDGSLFTADSMANRIGVILTDNGDPETITGDIVGYLIRSDEATLIMNGDSSGNRAWIDLPASAYTKVGPFSVVIKCGTTTIGACTGYMHRSTTDEIVDPGHVIPSIGELLAEIENTKAAGREATAAANTANTAATNANNKATVAQTAANTANDAASNADNKAAAAVTATGAANTAAAKIDGLTIIITQGDPSLPPSSRLDLVNGHYQLTITNVKGLKGDTGDAFHIKKTYSSVAAMNADYSGTDTAVGDYVMVTSNVEDPDNAKVFIKGSSAWQFVVDMSGATGIKGDTGTGITGASFANDQLTLNFSDGTSYTTPSLRGPQGIQGNQGERGPVGQTGEKGDKGDPFKIQKTYPSITAMEADYGTSQVALDEFVIIHTEAGDVDNGKVYKKGSSAWEFIVQMAGVEGPVGPGVPAGGTTGQYLRKNSDTDYDGDWESPANNLTTTEAGLVLDARQGKVLKDGLDTTNQILSKLDSAGNVTNDILTDALSCTKTSVFRGSGGNYTGTLPANQYKYGAFIVNIWGSIRLVIAQASNGEIATNAYDGMAWGGWQRLALNSVIDTSVIGSSPIVINSNTDLNTITTPGYYVCAYNATVATLTNCPVSIAFTMQVLKGTVDGNVIQIITDYYSGYTYRRIKHSTTWESWKQPALKNELDTPAYMNQTDAGITSNYTVRISRICQVGCIVQLTIIVNNGGTVFPAGRFTLLTVGSTKLRPATTNIPFVTTGGTSINGLVNRYVTGLMNASNGEIYIDNIVTTDVKEIQINLTYICLNS